MIRTFCRSLLPALCMQLYVSSVSAAGLPDYASKFFTGLTTLQADFDQVVTDANNQPMQNSQGHMWILRPGRFRWDYHTPYQQQLVADGKQVWSWDADLEQVTVQPVDEVLTSTPAMLLSGTAPLDQVFNFTEVNTNTVRLTPKSDDSNITDLELVFAGSNLSQIVAHDSFGNTTIFRFSHMTRNDPLADDLFHFVPPEGADVIGAAQ